jgi:hypothetical protein
MRPVLGLVLFHAFFIVCGAVILQAIGLGPRTRRASSLGVVVGPAFLIGVTLVVTVQAALVVVGVPVTLWGTALTGVGCVAIFWLLARGADLRRTAGLRARELREQPRASRSSGRLAAAATVVAALYLVYVAWSVARLPTVFDDARIWSLRGLTVYYHHGLQPEIFLNPGQSGAHPVYPLFQPVLEAVLFAAMGSAQLRFLHAELWLVCAAAIWTAAYLLARSSAPSGRARALWLAPLALVVVTPAVIINLGMGYADVTGSVLLAVGAMSLGLWLEHDRHRDLVPAMILLAAAANTKDEDLVATVVVLVVSGLVTLSFLRPGQIRRGLTRRVLPFAGAVVFVAACVLPWRIWVSRHDLRDSVEPSLPHALEPSFILTRGHELSQSATAMVSQTTGEYGELAAIFLVTCAICLITGTARRAATVYLASALLIAAALLWLYTTTSIPLSFLIPTSMNRTVEVFMLLSAVATAHLVAALTTSPQSVTPSLLDRLR